MIVELERRVARIVECASFAHRLINLCVGVLGHREPRAKEGAGCRHCRVHAARLGSPAHSHFRQQRHRIERWHTSRAIFPFVVLFIANFFIQREQKIIIKIVLYFCPVFYLFIFLFLNEKKKNKIVVLVEQRRIISEFLRSCVSLECSFIYICIQRLWCTKILNIVSPKDFDSLVRYSKRQISEYWPTITIAAFGAK